MVEGYYDNYNFSAEKLKTFPSYSQNRKDCMVQNGTKCRWEFSFTPSIGFLGKPDELLTNCELKLSFDRADPYTSLFQISDGGDVYEKPLDLVDVYAVTEYVTSPDIRDKFSSLDIRPFSYNFDDCDVLVMVSMVSLLL